MKLHEQLRPTSPAPSTVIPASGSGTVYDIPTAKQSAQSTLPASPAGQYHGRDHPDEMNYFSEPELDGPYRGQKPLGYGTTGGGSGGASPFNRRYGTLDAYYRSSDRVKYNGNGPPAKPLRFAGGGTVTPTRGLMLQSARPASSTIRPTYGKFHDKLMYREKVSCKNNRSCARRSRITLQTHFSHCRVPNCIKLGNFVVWKKLLCRRP